MDATLNAVKETTTKKIKEYKTTINVDDIVIENTRNDYQTLNVEYNDLKGRECEFNTLKQTYLLAGLLLKDDGIK